MRHTDSHVRLASPTKRLVIVADNSLIVEAIRVGLRKSGEFNLVGHADPHKTSASTIIGVRPDVVLLDDMDRSARALELIRELTDEDEALSVMVLSVQMDREWLAQLFDAGAAGAISKSTHPMALATLLRESLKGHIFHRIAGTYSTNGHDADSAASADLPLTTREVEILQLVASGCTNGEVARKLWVTEQTVKFHLRNIYRKLDVGNRTEASHFAHVNGLVSARRALAVASASDSVDTPDAVDASHEQAGRAAARAKRRTDPAALADERLVAQPVGS